ncbi:MAG: hypothetical protein E7474_12005 [Ruminococcaceae bacterium]|nr:hypothetical protein [Oscillospiraceae bacterium]
MRKRIAAALLALVTVLSLSPVRARAADELPPKTTKSNGLPYYIMVNRQMSTVTIYGLDENDCYSIPVRAMICSTGSSAHATPTGNFSIGKKIRWNLMLGDVYAQYLSQFYNSCLFHSVCYAKPRADTLLTGYYNNLGHPASHGCVRLQTEDAKWIYDNCDTGTYVTIYDSSDPGELGKPDRMIDKLPAGTLWDPTDPDPANPWAAQWTNDINLSAERIRLAPGETAALGVERLPEGTTYPTAMFRTDAPSVAVVDGAGRVRAVGVGLATVTVSCGAAEKSCLVAVTDDALPFCDVMPDMWFYPHVRYLYDRGLVSGSTEYAYNPDETLLRTEALHLLYCIAGKPPVAQTGGEDRAWFADALDWAYGEQLLDVDGSSLAMSRGDFIELLYRFDALRRSAVPDSEPGSAARWADRNGILLGDGSGVPALNDALTRSQAAALLHRYCIVASI